MTDLRQKVEDERGLLKKIQTVIPGYRGYREREDLRIADRLLREQLADKLAGALKDVEYARENLASDNDIEWLDNMGKLFNDLTAAQQKLRHAEQGYTGVSPDYRIEQYQLNRMYEWDLGLLSHIDNVQKGAEQLKTASASGLSEGVEKGMSSAKQALREFELIFGRRREAITGLLIEEVA